MVWVYKVISDAGTGIDERQALGTYGFLSNMTHPTLYPIREMTQWENGVPDHLESVLSLDLSFIEKLAGAAVVSYFNTLSLLMSYMGWDDSSLHGEWEGLIEARLPGTFPR